MPIYSEKLAVYRHILPCASCQVKEGVGHGPNAHANSFCAQKRTYSAEQHSKTALSALGMAA